MTPTLTEIDPFAVKWQGQALTDIRTKYDYSKGVHEVLFSGSVGCLREDALVETISGAVPIGDIKRSDYLLSYHEKSNQCCFVQGSGAFPKGKGNLYRVVSEHGEFVANENHLLATSPCSYQRIGDLFSCSSTFEAPCVQIQRSQEPAQLLLLLGALNCFEIVVNLISCCEERTRQCGLQLPLELRTFLDAFPLQADAQEYGLFFCKNTPLRVGGFQAPAPTPDRSAGQSFHLSMLSFFDLLESKQEALVNVYTQDDLKSYSHSLRDTLLRLLCHSHTAHPQDLLFFLGKFLPLLSSSSSALPIPYITNTTYKIEKLSSQDWYWDMKVPNTNNYISAGGIHHNSAKSILLAHIAITHCLFNKGARVLLGRRSMPDLKDTILQTVLEHIGDTLIEGTDYVHDKTKAKITFSNGSEIISRSWADKKYKKMRSLLLSLAIIEELTENDKDEFYKEIKMRVGRLPHIKEKLIVCASNPDAPSHWAYQYFIENKSPSRHVYYSVTYDNPFLPASYIEGIKETLSPKEARRMLHGEWLSVVADVVYYNYEKERNYIDKEYIFNYGYPIDIMFDFNIAYNKPMSAAIGQYINGTFVVARDFVVKGARTQDILEEIESSGILQKARQIRVFGDAAGSHNDTRSKLDDYQIIDRFIRASFSGARYERCVPRSNPPIRKRHNLVNSQFLNDNKEVRFFVYRNAQVVDKGMRLVKLKQGSQYIEDDSDEYQHVTTAIGYWVCKVLGLSNRRGISYIPR